jgi:putative spermidine/putrescine transport system ATP-binding protein
MDAGRVEQLGPPPETYDRPATAFVARFMGVENLLTVRVAGKERKKVRVSVGPLSATVDAPATPDGSGSLTLAARADAVAIGEPDQPGMVSARIAFANNRGASTLYELLTDDSQVL